MSDIPYNYRTTNDGCGESGSVQIKYIKPQSVKIGGDIDSTKYVFALIC